MKLQRTSTILLICCVIKLTVCRPENSYNTNNESGSLFANSLKNNSMDPVIVAEVLKTGKPYVKTETDDKGVKRTTTYRVGPDGTISRSTISEYTSTAITSPHIHHRLLDKSTESLPNLSSTPKKVDTDWEWNPTTTSQNGVPSSHNNVFPQWTPTWKNSVPSSNAPEGNGNTITLPTTWNTQLWPTLQTGNVDVSRPTTDTNTVINSDGTKVTTTRIIGPTKWYTRTFTYPSVDLWSEKETPSTTTKLPDMGTVRPLPSLTDFLESQYGTSTINSLETSKGATTPIPSNHPNRPPTSFSTKPVTTININDLPVIKTRQGTFDIPINGSISSTKTLKVERIPQTYFPEQPHFSYPLDKDAPVGPFFIKSTATQPGTQFSASHGNAEFPTDEPHTFSGHRTQIFKTNLDSALGQTGNPINNFLKKVDITPDTIAASNGELTRTIVDDNGRVLTATFVLSSVRNDENKSVKDIRSDPIK